MIRPSARRMLGLLDRQFADPYDDMVGMLGKGSAFAFSRFGDGEFNAIFGAGEQKANCDGHPYYEDLGQRLEQIVKRRPGYLMGLQPLAVLVHGAQRIQRLAKGTRWVLAESLHDAAVELRLGSFLAALDQRETILVAPDHLRDFALARGWRHLAVPSEHCWLAYSEVRERLESSVADEGEVVLFCASMMSNVLIDDLFCGAPDNTYIDVGSVFDPYGGVKSRDYHDHMEEEFANLMKAEGH